MRHISSMLSWLEQFRLIGIRSPFKCVYWSLGMRMASLDQLLLPTSRISSVDKWGSNWKKTVLCSMGPARPPLDRWWVFRVHFILYMVLCTDYLQKCYLSGYKSRTGIVYTVLKTYWRQLPVTVHLLSWCGTALFLLVTMPPHLATELDLFSDHNRQPHGSWFLHRRCLTGFVLVPLSSSVSVLMVFHLCPRLMRFEVKERAEPVG